MTYTGEVEVGGPPDVRRIAGLIIVKLRSGPMDNNAYLLRCTPPASTADRRRH